MHKEEQKLIKWEERFSVFVPSLDNQHRKLIDLINQLYVAHNYGQKKEALESILEDVTDYTRYHFAYEEKLLQAYEYPDEGKHKAAHKSLSVQVWEFRNRFENTDADLWDELLEFLKGWLLTHILISDMQYSQFLKDKGAT